MTDEEEYEREFAERQKDPETATGPGLERIATTVGLERMCSLPSGEMETDVELRERVLIALTPPVSPKRISGKGMRMVIDGLEIDARELTFTEELNTKPVMDDSRAGIRNRMLVLRGKEPEPPYKVVDVVPWNGTITLDVPLIPVTTHFVGTKTAIIDAARRGVANAGAVCTNVDLTESLSRPGHFDLGVTAAVGGGGGSVVVSYGDVERHVEAEVDIVLPAGIVAAITIFVHL